MNLLFASLFLLIVIVLSANSPPEIVQDRDELINAAICGDLEAVWTCRISKHSRRTQ